MAKLCFEGKKDFHIGSATSRRDLPLEFQTYLRNHNSFLQFPIWEWLELSPELGHSSEGWLERPEPSEAAVVSGQVDLGFEPIGWEFGLEPTETGEWPASVDFETVPAPFGLGPSDSDPATVDLGFVLGP